MTSKLFIIVEAGVRLCKIRASSYSFAGYKLGKCNRVTKVHFEYRFIYYVHY